MRSGKRSTLSDDVDDVVLCSIEAPQLERIEVPDNADIPAKRRNSRRFIHVLLRAKAAAQN
jgi:hypothetical protein